MNLHTIVECPRSLTIFASSLFATSRPYEASFSFKFTQPISDSTWSIVVANFRISKVLSNSSSLSKFYALRIHRHIQTPASVSLQKFVTTLFRNARPNDSLSLPWCYANDSCAGTNLSARLLLPLRTLAAAYLSRSPSWGPYSGPYYRFSRPLPLSSFLTRRATLSQFPIRIAFPLFSANLFAGRSADRGRPRPR